MLGISSEPQLGTPLLLFLALKIEPVHQKPKSDAEKKDRNNKTR